MAIKQQMDGFDKHQYSADVEETREVNAARQFLSDFPEFYNSDNNARLLKAWLAEKPAPTTRRNLGIAYIRLQEMNALEERPVEVTPEPKQLGNGITKIDSTLARPKYSAAGTPSNRAALANDYAVRYDLAGPPGTDPKKSQLGRLHRESLVAERVSRNREGLPERWAEARALLRIHRPNLKPDSVDFNTEVARKLAEAE